MSLIEQAAKRLEELRRAGATVPDEPASPPVQDDGPKPRQDHVPTPEALVRELNTKGESAAPVAGDAHPEPAMTPPKPDGRRVEPEPKPKVRVEIDLAHLKDLGFVTPDAPQSQIADEFRVLKRPILQNAYGRSTARIRNGNLVLVTSALPGEGKTFTAVNLAISMAMEYDNTVLLVDGDVAHPSLPDLLGVPPSPGLLDLLIRDDLDIGDALVQTNIEKLTVLPAGSRHRRATELLASEKMATVVARAGVPIPGPHDHLRLAASARDHGGACHFDAHGTDRHGGRRRRDGAAHGPPGARNHRELRSRADDAEQGGQDRRRRLLWLSSG